MTESSDQQQPEPEPEPEPVPDGPGPAEAGPQGLLSDVRRLRSMARTARHAYWLPLMVFGVLTCASAPFYIQPPFRSGVILSTGPYLPFYGGFAARGLSAYLAYYWLAAIVAGLVVTGLWYRRHGRRAGVVTSSRGYLITGALLVLATLLLPFVSQAQDSGPVAPFIPGDLLIRGTFPFLIIAAGMWVLAWAERSRGLAAICLIYTGTAVLASLYDIENVLFRLGWDPSSFQWRLTALPNVLLPALVLLVGGLAAMLAQQRQRSAG